MEKIIRRVRVVDEEGVASVGLNELGDAAGEAGPPLRLLLVQEQAAPDAAAWGSKGRLWGHGRAGARLEKGALDG